MGTTSSKPSASSQAPAFHNIQDNFTKLDDVQAALRQNGLESSSLIVALDFTKSNEWTGKASFNGRSLHWLGHEPNPYEQATLIIAKTLAAFDDDGLIPAYGFGDSSTADKAVFSMFHNGQPAPSLDALVLRYKELVPYIRLSGPTSFAPAIYQAMKLVVDSGCQYHILLLVADGQVTRSVDMPRGSASNQEQETIDAIVAASNLPLSIVMVGVGDGPWDVMKEFDDMLPQRKWDNFQFVNYTDIAARYRSDQQRLEAVFATQALMEIPEQFKIIQKLKLLGKRASLSPQHQVRCLDPPGPPSSMGPPHTAAPSFGSQSFGPYGGPPGPYGGPPGPGAGSFPQQGFGGVSYPPYPQASVPGYGAPPGGAQYPAPGYPQAYQPYQPSPSMGHYPGGAAAAGPSYSAAPPPQASCAATAATAAAAAAGPSCGRHSCGTPAAGAGSGPGAGAGGGEAVDPLFICPISQEVMKDPVVAADGFTYDRVGISQWLKTHDTSPMTNARLPHKNLTPNHALRSSVMEKTAGA